MTFAMKPRCLRTVGMRSVMNRWSPAHNASTCWHPRSMSNYREWKTKCPLGYRPLAGLQSLWSQWLWSLSFGKLVSAQPYGLLLGGSRDARSLTRNLLLACSILPTQKTHASMSPRGARPIQSLMQRGED